MFNEPQGAAILGESGGRLAQHVGVGRGFWYYSTLLLYYYTTILPLFYRHVGRGFWYVLSADDSTTTILLYNYTHYYSAILL